MMLNRIKNIESSQRSNFKIPLALSTYRSQRIEFTLPAIWFSLEFRDYDFGFPDVSLGLLNITKIETIKYINYLL